MSGASSPRDRERPEPNPQADEYVARLVRIKARQLVGRYGFTESDREDIEQELKLDLLERLPDYDPDRGSLEGFVSGVVDHKISRFLEKRSAAKRNPDRVAYSLNDAIADEQGGLVERAAAMPDETLPRGRQQDLVLDLADALSELPPDLRRLCCQLREKGVTEIARQEGVSRKTVYERIKRIREKLRERGLDAYL